ncbi:uncharacterized protein HKW66_Vig0112610 [Vigna angularis]|uniref:Uncharacterized protein n=1 Tax=Phaseolus angularis TaxID=3914 RepID=A0A8T0KY50_PHAAN|nr:uncharacterized protein HKW66_Vig0112610 [Vigna angularis]
MQPQKKTVSMEKMKAAVAPPSPSPTKKRSQPTKKRSLSTNAHPTYVKIRALVKEISHLVIEFLTLLFDLEELKMITSLYESLQADGFSLKGKKLRQSGIKLDPPSVSGSQKLFRDGLPETYMVGASVFGWNFITFLGKEPVYYGRSKAEYRAGKVSK